LTIDTIDASRVDFDLSCSNPSRIFRLPGTINRKGVETPERPYALAEILWLPETPQVFDVSRLLADARAWQESTNPGRPGRPTRTFRKEVQSSTSYTMDMAGYIQRYHPEVEWGAVDRCQCPFHGGDNPTSLWVSEDGAFCHACQTGYSLISAIMADQRCTVSEAYRYAEQAGIIDKKTADIPLTLDYLND